MNNTVEFEGFKTRILPNIPILETKLPEPIIQYLWGLIKIAEDKPENLKDGLAGNISKSSKLVDTQGLFNKFCIPTLQEVDQSMGRGWHTLNSGKSPRYDLTHLWVNYQRQTEFNPQHDHGGAYSFVVWMKIPTSNKEQRELPIQKRVSMVTPYQTSHSHILIFLEIYEMEHGSWKKKQLVQWSCFLLDSSIKYIHSMNVMKNALVLLVILE